MDKLKNKKLLISSALFSVYAVLTLIGALNHEIWFDEGQAWCIARDNDILGVINQMKYEGHPPLWHFILYPFAHLGFSVDVIPLISWFISVVTVALILWKSPFHIAVNASVIFSSGFLFYNSVISRVYCLIQLFLCLIAIVYPLRKKHPLIFGLLVALLANTHIMMCGLVGILGIYMVIDLFKDWKKNAAKNNAMNLCGLAVAGIGVILLILPLMESLTVSKAGTDIELTFYLFFNRVSNSLLNVGKLLFPEGVTGIISTVIYCIFAEIVLVFFVVFRRYRKGLIAAVVFSVFFLLTTQVIYYVMHTTRAAIFIYTLFFIMWAAKLSEKPLPTKQRNLSDKVDSKIIKKLLKFIETVDQNTDKAAAVVITSLMLFSLPRGVISLFSDYKNEYCMSKAVAEFIDTELPDDAVIVSNKIFCAQISAYLPEAKLYTLRYQEFVTYTTMAETEEYVDWEKAYNDLKGYENTYLLIMRNEPHDTKRNDILYQDGTETDNIIQLAWAQITPLDVEKEIKPLIGTETENL